MISVGCLICINYGTDVCNNCRYYNKWKKIKDIPTRNQTIKVKNRTTKELLADATTFTDYLDVMETIHKAKNNDYSPEGAFGNFAESEKVGVPGWKGAFIRLQDKYTRACNLIKGKEMKVADEKLEDTLIDMANYALIILVLRKMGKEEN